MKFVRLFIITLVVNLFAFEIFKEVFGKQGFSEWGVYLYFIFFLLSWFTMLGFLVKENNHESGFKIALDLLKIWGVSMAALVVIGLVVGVVF
jgi:hypothetical protein